MSYSDDPMAIEEAGRGEPLRVRVTDLAEGHAKKLLYESLEGNPEEIVVCRLQGRIYALDSFCPHEGGRIAEGPMMEGRYLHCPLHLYRFNPENGQAVEVECMPAQTFVVDEEDGDALVWVHGAPSDRPRA